jgi:cell division inhibitor SepF
VLDLRGTEPDTVRRLVDFASGITYALEGTMQKVAQGVILVAPARTTLSEDEVRRLAALGLYDVQS